MRVLLLTGKGGVGKTSLAAATALRAAREGHRVFLLSTDPAHSLGDALGRSLGARAQEIAPGVVGQEISVLDELERAWSDIHAWLRALLREDAEELVSEELLVFPGLEELMALRAVREVEAYGEFDLCVVDCAPTGATLRMLRFPDALRVFMENLFDLERRGARLLRPVADRMRVGRLIPREEFFEAFERLYHEIEDVRQILLDGDRTTARLVVNPARVVVDEARRSFAYLSLYGVTTDAVLVNRVLPAAAKGGYFRRWAEREAETLREIDASFALPQMRAELRPAEVIGVEALQALGDELYGDTDPAAVLCDRRPIRLSQRGGRTTLEIDLPNAEKDELEVGARGDLLFVRVRDAERRIALPASVVGREIASARLRDGVLRVAFGA